MRVAVSSTGTDLDALMDPRFGRCPYFLMIETGDMSFEVVRNTSAALGGGAGIQSAQLVSSQGAGAVITGRCGPNAMEALLADGIDLYLDNEGSVKEIFDQYKAGHLEAAYKAKASGRKGSSANITGKEPHARVPVGSVKQGRGQGGGMGRGRGRGKGVGR